MHIYLEAYGCTLNQGEARIFSEIAYQLGFELTERIEEADIILLATCTVIETTERKMIKRITALSKYGKPFVVSGCMAAIQREKIYNAAPNAIIIPLGKSEMFQYFLNSIISRKSIVKPRVQKYYVDAIIPISQGCMGECTYCITRFARGRLKSYSIKKIVSATDKWLKRGVKEIKLTAQDTAAYGMDYDDGTNIYELVSKIVKLKGDFRIRIGMMNPKSAIKILPKIIDMYRYEKVYKFLHLPLQSGDNRVLSRMMRGYTVEDFIYVIKKVRSAVNNLMLSTDIIVGFPGETADEFEKSIEVIKQIKPDIVNITRFSAREGTAAAHMKPQVVSRIAKERSRILSELRFKISKEINTKFVGSFEKILLTERGKNNTFVGRTSAYRPVVIDANNFKIGDFVNVKIIFAMPTYLIGKPV